MLHILFVVTSLAITSYSLEEYQFLGSCNEKSIPYKITINEFGRPELLCASPTCLGDEYIMSDRHHTHVHHKAFNVTCQGYRDDNCEAENQWIAGFMEAHTGDKLTFKSKCCTYPGLANAKPVKTVVLQSDEEFTGGAYVRNEGVGGFDVIKEVRRRVQRGIVKFEVTVVRLPCQLDEADDYDLPASPRQRTGYPADHKPFRGLPRRPLYRSPFRPFGLRRRNYIDDYYYDYEEDIYQPRRRFELRGGRNRVRTGGNVLWPIAYKSPRGKAFAAENEEATDPYAPPQEVKEEIQVEASEPAPNMVIVVQEPGVKTGQAIQMPAYPSPNVVGSSYARTIEAPAPAPAPVESLPAPVVEQPAAAVQPITVENSGAYQTPMVVAQQPIAPVGITYGPMVPPVPDIQVAQPAASVNTQYQPAASGNGYAVAQPDAVQQVYQQSYPQQTSYQQTSYQSSGCGSSCGTSSCCGGGFNGLFGQMQCFSGDSEVQTTAGKKLMRDLEVGDVVMSYDESVISYSPVVMFLHKLDDVDAEFVKITTVNNQTLELTAFHLIYVSTCKPSENSRLLHAKEVTPGDCVNIPTDRGTVIQTAVRDVNIVQKKGIYAPLTFTGDIFVNEILTSCHSNLGLQILQQSFFKTYKGVSSFFSRISSWNLLKYGEELPTGVSFLTSAMDIFLPHSF